jgi:hypothetical protein
MLDVMGTGSRVGHQSHWTFSQKTPSLSTSQKPGIMTGVYCAFLEHFLE